MPIQITGLEQVQRRLKEASKLLVLRTYAKAADRAMGVVAAEVEARAPIGPEGSLGEHVIVKTEVDTNGRGVVSTVGFDSSKDERTGIPQDLKALLVEFGHRQVTHAPEKKQVGHVPAHPFVRPAFDASADRAVEVFAETVIENLSVIEETT